MHAYFSSDIGKRHVFVLHGLGGAGKSQIAFKFVDECQVDAETSRYAIHMLKKHLHQFLTIFTKVFGSVFH